MFLPIHHPQPHGTGYPDGLAGDHIPIASRILLVTDAFDAMTTDRPYRKRMPVKAAIEELKRHSGSQFDPAACGILSLCRPSPRRTAPAPDGGQPARAE